MRFLCTPPHSCMELIELSGWWPSNHSQVVRWVAKHQFRQADVHRCSRHLLSDAIFILTHPHKHVHKCTLAHESCPSHLFKDPSWAFALIWFVRFLPPSAVIYFFSSSHLSPTVKTVISNSLLASIFTANQRGGLWNLVHLILENGF